MALRKHLIQNISDSQQDEDNQEDGAAANTDYGDELPSLLRSTSSAPEKRRTERKNHSKQKEMTEEEMMDLALQLSKREASNTALRQQQEDEDVMKAIQESMANQTKSCLNSVRKPRLDDAPLSIGSRRKLSVSSGEKLPEKCCAFDGDMNSEVVGPRDETITRSKKRKRGAGSPLMELPDLSQTQKMSSQNTPGSTESFSAHLDSPQSSDSTHIEDSQVQVSPVFPLTGCRVEVHIDRLNCDLVETCKSSGFVLSSQNSVMSPEKSGQPRSPRFSQSNKMSCPKSPVFPGDDKGHEGSQEQSPKFVKSPVFGRTADCEMSLGTSNYPSCENSEFGFCSQESVIFSAKSCPPQSPVFPKSPSERSSPHKNSDLGQVEHGEKRLTRPVFGLTEPQTTDQQEKPAELRKGSDQSSSDSRKPGCQTTECNRQASKSGLKYLNEKSESWNAAETELTGDMTLIRTEQDDDDNVTPLGSSSPVFPEEKAAVEADSQPGSSLNNASASSLRPSGPDCSQQQLSTSELQLHPGEPSDSQTIHYYWGVPFCPRGLDPDTYTKVIVAQMEVYEKSLKEAQRGLLKKAEWGKAIQPQPQRSLSPETAESTQPCLARRRGLRLRRSKRGDAADFLLDEEDDGKEEGGDKQQENEEEKKEGDEMQTDTDDCEICPETQLSDNNSTKDLSCDADVETQKGPKLPEIEMILRDDTQAKDESQKLEFLKDDNEGQTAGDEGKAEEGRKDPDVEEMEDRGLQRSESPKLEVAIFPRSPETSVDCPICQGSFPSSEIEMHAAYCDGEVAVVSQTRTENQDFQDSVKPRRKRVRRTEATSEETTHLSDVCRRQEKCFICQKSILLRDYSRHTELCVQRGTARRAGKGNLLSALERTESRDSGAGPSGSKIQPEAVIDLRYDDDDNDEEVSASRISNSPIRSFTPISEVNGCLIDFRKQQRAKKPSQRRR